VQNIIQLWNSLNLTHHFLCIILGLHWKSENRERLKYVWNVCYVITNHERDLQPQKPQKVDVFHLSGDQSWNCKCSLWFLFQDTPSISIYYWKSRTTSSTLSEGFWKTRIPLMCTVTQAKRRLIWRGYK